MADPTDGAERLLAGAPELLTAGRVGAALHVAGAVAAGNVEDLLKLLVQNLFDAVDLNEQDGAGVVGAYVGRGSVGAYDGASVTSTILKMVSSMCVGDIVVGACDGAAVPSSPAI